MRADRAARDVELFSLKRILTLIFAFAVTATSICYGQDRLETLSVSIKSSSIGSHAPEDALLHPDRDTSAELLRFRLMLEDELTDWSTYEVAYEHRMRWSSEGNQGSLGLFPSEWDAPYRITQLDSKISGNDRRYGHWHEIDRALLALTIDWGHVTIGRQAIGLGRGTLFGAIDVFSPFSPLEVDREWRRGVDAIRAEAELSDTSSIEWISAFGERANESAHLLRVRGYAGTVDGELVIGERADDEMFGGAASAAVWGASVVGEFAVFKTPERQPHDGLWGNDHLVGKAVCGSSYTFDVGNGLTLNAEYHYSGFGMKDVRELPIYFSDPIFRARYLRGDTQILGRQALALQTTYVINEGVAGTLLLMGNPEDGSGMINPALAFNVTDTFEFTIALFCPWGDKPRNGQMRSIYGGSPQSIFLQLNWTF